MMNLNRSPLRFVVFLLVLAVLFTYIALKWNRFNEETVADGTGDSIISLIDSTEEGDGARTTPSSDVNITPPVDIEGASYNYFIEARLQREKARSAQEAILREIIDNPKSGEDTRDRAQKELLALSKRAGLEAELERLIRAKGFEDVLVYLHDDAVMVVVQAEALTGEEVARIADIVNRFASVPLQAMSIIPKPN